MMNITLGTWRLPFRDKKAYGLRTFVLLTFYLLLSYHSFAQNSIKLNEYVEKKISTVIVYYNEITEPFVKANSTVDSLINNRQRVSWETVLKINENKDVIATRTLKRIQVAYLNQSDYFYDSQMPNKSAGIVTSFIETYHNLVDTSFNEIVPISINKNKDIVNFKNRPYLYNILPYETKKYISSIFFFQNAKIPYQINDHWSDTLITEKSVLLSNFTIKSVSMNNLVILFHNSIIKLNHKNDNQFDSDNTIVKFNVSETSLDIEGLMNVDSETHFIYSIEGTTSSRVESSINDGNKKSDLMVSKYRLSNKIE